MRPISVAAILALAACSHRAALDVPPAPWDYPAGSTLTAGIGVGSSAVGAQLLESGNPTKRAVGAGFAGAGAAGLGLAAAQADIAGQNRDRRVAAEELAGAVDAMIFRQDRDRFMPPKPVDLPPDTKPKADSPLAQPK